MSADLVVSNRTNEASAQIVAITERAQSHRTLEALLDWCLAQRPPILDTTVVTQDELTHDVIVRLPEGLVAVYDAN